MNDATMPTAPEAERAALASILLNPAALAEVREAIATPEAFTGTTERAVFAEIVRLDDAGRAPSIEALVSALAGRVSAAEIGELCAACSTSARAAEFAALVADAHARRRAIEAARRLVLTARDAGTPLAEALGILEGDLRALDDASAGPGEVEAVGAVGARLLAGYRATAANPTRPSGCPAGLAILAALGIEWRPGEVSIVAARPSVGKTAIMLQLARHAATAGWSVLVLSLEMSADALTERLLCHARAKPRDAWLRHASSAAGEIARAERAVTDLADLPIFIDDAPRGLTTRQIAARVRRFKRRHPRALVLTDYLGLIRPADRRAGRYEATTEISGDLKRIARAEGVPLVVASQLNRAGTEARGRDIMAALRDSGAIEQDADIVIALRRLSEPEIAAAMKEGETAERAEALRELIVAKHRNGPTGAAWLEFSGPRQWFDELSNPTEEESLL